jgi:hypothetical protein
MIGRFVVPALLVAIGLGITPHVVAGSGTPAAGGELVTAAECTVAPRSADDLRALFREVAATPVPGDLAPTPEAMPMGTPADEATTRAVNGAWREIVACLSAGDQTRLFALYSDDMVRRQLQVDMAFGVTEDALIAYLEASPVPISDSEGLAVDPLADVQILADGRVVAAKPTEAGHTEALVFIQHDDRWLLDEWYEVG